MNSQRRSAAAVGAKTARACESCISRRARWYCMADNAFLCQSCDDSVHSANPLASRHERVRLKNMSSCGENLQSEPLPAWLCGFRRKARTPRRSKAGPTLSTVAVPDMAGDSRSEHHQLLHRVPIFDPNICSSSSSLASDPKPARAGVTISSQLDDISGFLADEDMEDFSIESLLGHGHDEDIFCMAELGLLEKTQDLKGCCFEAGRVKQEEDDVDGLELSQVDHEVDVPWRTLDLNFDYESPTIGLEGKEEAEEEEQKGAVGSYVLQRKGISLRLDYKSVIAGWACQGSPWVTGDRPSDFNLDNAWPDCIASYPAVENMNLYGMTGARGAVDGGGEREARVSRYREKRQNRLFSKKIRYEVRKLNAEKRPRMKGRFVKRPLSLEKSTFSF